MLEYLSGFQLVLLINSYHCICNPDQPPCKPLYLMIETTLNQIKPGTLSSQLLRKMIIVIIVSTFLALSINQTLLHIPYITHITTTKTVEVGTYPNNRGRMKLIFYLNDTMFYGKKPEIFKCTRNTCFEDWHVKVCLFLTCTWT